MRGHWKTYGSPGVELLLLQDEEPEEDDEEMMPAMTRDSTLPSNRVDWFLLGQCKSLFYMKLVHLSHLHTGHI